MTATDGVFAVVTGGGTSGHVLPALAIADALVAAGYSREQVHYVGSARGVEVDLLPPTGYPATFLDVIGLQRSVSRRNLAFVPKLWRSVRAARRLLSRLRPAVVINVGGYASFPMTYAARRAGVPYVVVSWDHRPGLVSRVVARGAAACAVSDESSRLPNARLTGAPVRAELVTLDRAADRRRAREELALPQDRFVVAVVCGSLGAASVNAIVSDVVGRLHDRRDLAVYHVVGDRFLASAAPARDGADGILYRVIGYETRMASLYSAADLLITRAGAGTLAELTTVGAPALVVPWAGAADDHQLANARQLATTGAVMLIEQHELTSQRLIQELERLQAAPGELTAMGERAYAAGARHRSDSLITLIRGVADRGGSSL